MIAVAVGTGSGPGAGSVCPALRDRESWTLCSAPMRASAGSGAIQLQAEFMHGAPSMREMPCPGRQG